MPTTLSQIDIINQALALIGVKPIVALDTPDDVPSEQARIAWPGAFEDVARECPWNCLLHPVKLEPEAQEPISGEAVPAFTNWAPATAYAVGQWVSFGEPQYLYQALIAHVSSASFTNDLTAGLWMQSDVTNPDPFSPCGQVQYASGWPYKYPLPEDCLLVATFNDRYCEGKSEDFEIIGSALYTAEPTAVIKYVQNTNDTTRYDPMLVACLKFKLAEMLSSMLRQDDTNISVTMGQRYTKAISRARTKNANEGRRRRFDPVANSRWVGSRYFSTNG